MNNGPNPPECCERPRASLLPDIIRLIGREYLSRISPNFEREIETRYLVDLESDRPLRLNPGASVLNIAEDT